LKIVSQFGHTYAADHLIEDSSIEDIEDYIMVMMRSSKAYGDAAVVCTTNNQQVEVNDLLEEMGFSSTPFMKKLMHPETRVKMWWKALHE
jgi:hypothetical protein